jgi:hypothetical protein
MKVTSWTAARLLTALIIGTATATAVAEKTTVSAVIPWQAQGQVFQTNTGKAQFLGSLEGIMYAENAEGEMDEAFVRCPIVQDINLADGTSSTTGKCIIVVSPEDTVYAEIDCEGKAGLCRGEFRISGGAGRFEGVKGSGKMTARSPVHALASDLSGGVTLHAAAGILQMPVLEVEMP